MIAAHGLEAADPALLPCVPLHGSDGPAARVPGHTRPWRIANIVATDRFEAPILP